MMTLGFSVFFGVYGFLVQGTRALGFSALGFWGFRGRHFLHVFPGLCRAYHTS